MAGEGQWTVTASTSLPRHTGHQQSTSSPQGTCRDGLSHSLITDTGMNYKNVLGTGGAGGGRLVERAGKKPPISHVVENLLRPPRLEMQSCCPSPRHPETPVPTTSPHPLPLELGAWCTSLRATRRAVVHSQGWPFCPSPPTRGLPAATSSFSETKREMGQRGAQQALETFCVLRGIAVGPQ